MSSNCMFCLIVSKEIKSDIVFENEHVSAFKDINPQAPVHILIVSKKHLKSLAETGPEDVPLLGEMQRAAVELAARYKLDDGFRLVVNNGREAGQSVDHLHYHLLGGRRLKWPPG
ncbi:MAG: histidine triad nucleotide-binding protein [Elusimicrobia bacterium]|nr:histidine triad nucleotide-binding protein [Elusimicrobiota bacterium]